MWTLATYSTIFVSLRLKEENQVVLSFETLMDDISLIANEMVLMASNIKREVCTMLSSYLSLLTIYDFLMLDLRFKNIHIISSFV
jgi:hypothetical protein